MTLEQDAKTEVGNYFIANYPPFSFWTRAQVRAIAEAFALSPAAGTLGLYLHIPFCRKRCRFCYYKVYTDVNARAIEDYADALAAEVALAAAQPALAGRPAQFVYFGGGTPSYLSVRQLDDLAARLRRSLPWDRAQEVTFECEPGTLTEPKVRAIKDLGVTRLSLGVENFCDAILEENGRAHLSHEIFRAWEWIARAGFAQVNIDLIAGMVGETWENWRENIRQTIVLAPDSVTIYQLELPYNTRYSKSLLVLGEPVDVATWPLKREWVNYAFDELLAAGYEVSSAYTLVKRGRGSGFLYRDSLWHGADLLAAGVASFGHLSGVHYQNVDGIEEYQTQVRADRLPIGRALALEPVERLIRELVLQLKLGRIDAGYFRDKFGRDIRADFAAVFGALADAALLTIAGDIITLTRKGLLRVDAFLPRFFLPQHHTNRYT